MQINQNNSENELVESQLRLEITEKNNRIRTQQQEMQRQYREYESIICEKDGEISSTRAELLFLETKCETLERDNTRLSQKVEEYVDRLRNRDLTKESELRGRIKELEEELGRRDEVELLSSDIQEQIKKKQKEFEDLQEQHRELSFQYEALQISYDQDQQSQNQRVEDLLTQNQQLLQQINQSKNSNEQQDVSRTQRELIAKLQQEVKQYQSQLEEYKNQYTDNLMYYDDQLQELTEENKRLRQQQNIQKDEGDVGVQIRGGETNSYILGGYEEDVKRQQLVIEEKDRHIEELEKYCQSVSQDNQFQKGERLKLQMQIDDLQDRYRRDLKDLNKADEQVKELKVQLKETQQKLYLAEGISLSTQRQGESLLDSTFS
eukprot:TRINITY_DN14137_c0_g1_i3.p1 TRINITY_DN14137_c0_g1~~TRINITY_DN14137_c0_g1_i3.p1  ORF type:complete len:377 (-),score=62.19 TRINITY_DN14137_c0_g1_i3:48-1178(-)